MGIFHMGSSNRKDTPYSKTENIIIRGKSESMANKFRFKVIEEKAYKTYFYVHIRYNDATSYDGNKILIYKKADWERVKSMVKINGIDPHFIEDNSSPIARFAPTLKGKALAKKFCENN